MRSSTSTTTAGATCRASWARCARGSIRSPIATAGSRSASRSRRRSTSRSGGRRGSGTVMRGAGLALAVVACAAGIAATPALAQSDGWFEQRPFPERSFTLDDLGVTDYDGDGDLDVFTTNHLSTQLLLANDGGGAFEDRLTDAGLNQTPGVPGWEDEPSEPSTEEAGLYLFRNGGITLELVGDGRAAS